MVWSECCATLEVSKTTPFARGQLVKMACSKQMEDLDRTLECPVCLERFKNPRILDCLHSFCEHCIGEHMTKKEQNGVFPCPVCNEEFKVPDDGAKGLKHNAFLSKVSGIFPRGPNEEKCDVCKIKDVDSQAESVCIQCGDHLCEQCSSTHTSGSTFTANHQVISLDDIRSGKCQEQIQSLKKGRCLSHPEKVEDIYCERCEKPVCPLCLDLEHTRHPMMSVDQAIQSADGVVHRLLEPWSEVARHCEMLCDEQKKILEDIAGQEEYTTNEIKRIYSDFRKETLKEIETQENAAIEKLKKHIAAARKQAETWSEEAETRKTEVTNTLNYVTKALDFENVEKLRKLNDIKARLDDLDIKNIEAQSRKPIFNLQPSQIAVPDLKIDVVAELQTKNILSNLLEKMDDYLQILQQPLRRETIKERAVQVHSFSAGSYGRGLTATVDWFISVNSNSDETHVKVFNKQTWSLLFEVQQGNHTLENPRGVTYSKSVGHTFVTDWGIKGVVRYDSKGNVVKVFPALYNKEGMVTCHDEQLIITDRQGECLLITDLDCNIQQCISKSSLGLNQFNPWYVCVDNRKHIVVSDQDHKCVYVISTKPAVLQTYTTQNLSNPRGVCVDQWGHILVADYGYKRVVLLTDPQEQERVIITSNDVRYPKDLAITAPGQVAVLEERGNVKIFQYVE